MLKIVDKTRKRLCVARLMEVSSKQVDGRNSMLSFVRFLMPSDGVVRWFFFNVGRIRQTGCSSFSVVKLIILWMSIANVSLLSVRAQDPSFKALNPEVLRRGANEVRVRHQSELRRLMVITPTSYEKTKSYPVLFCFHGAGGRAESQCERWKRHVDRRSLILISVDAVQSLKKWNFKEDFHEINYDDVDLIRKVTHALVSSGVADSKAIYATGHSSGGLFCYRLAKETSLFAAVCPMSCGMAKDAHDPDQNTGPVNLMQVIGDRDKSYHGTTNPKVTMHSAEKRMAVWRAFYECKVTPVTKVHGKELVVRTYTNGDGIELAICEAKGQGHHLRRDLRDAADVIALEFMLSHRRE